MSDLDSYLARIVDEQDAVLFAEAVSSAKANAFRGAYILIWISCAEAIKRRFNTVKARDHKARKIAGEIARKEANHQSVDMYLLEKAREYGFITDPEFSKLHHIYEMRCIFGHPYEEQPSSEELLSAAAVVVNIILAQPVRLRHGYLEEQQRVLLSNKAFLDDVESAVVEFGKEVAGRADPLLLEWFFEKVWSEAETLIPDPAMALFVRRAVWFSRAVLHEMPDDVFSAWELRGPLAATPIIASYVFADDKLFSQLKRHAQDMVVGNLIDRAETTPRALVHAEKLNAAGVLAKRHQKRFIKAVEDMSFQSLGSSGLSLQHTCERIITELQSHNWYTQNPAVDMLANYGPSAISEVDDSVQRALGNNILQAADGNAGHAMSFLDSVAADSDEWPSPFIAGIVEECFINDDTHVRFKTHCAERALRTLTAIPKKERARILAEIADGVSDGEWKPGMWHERAQEEMVELLTNMDDAGIGCMTKMRSLRRAVANRELEEED